MTGTDVSSVPEAGDINEGDPNLPSEARTLSEWIRHHAADLTPTRHPAFRRLLIGQATAFIGSMLTQVAVPVQVYDISGSSLQVGFVGLAGLVPIVVFGLYGGAIADAVDRRTLYLWSSLGAWGITLALLAQAAMNVNSVALILCLVFIQSAGFAISSSTRGAIVPRIVPIEEVPAANTLTFTAGNIGQVVGPLIAGVLVTRSHGFVYAYGIDALLFTVALYSVLRLPSIPPDGNAARPGLRSVVDGLKFIGTSPVLVMSFGVDVIAMVLAMPRSLFPAVAADRFHGNVGPVVCGDRDRSAGRRRIRRLDRSDPAAGGRAHRCSGRLGRLRRHLGPGASTLAGGPAAGVRRRRRPGQCDLPANHPADLRPGPDARTDAGCLHRGRGRWSTARRRAGGRDGRGHQSDLLVGHRRRAVCRRGRDRRDLGPRVLALRRARGDEDFAG